MTSIIHLIDTGGPGGAESVFVELACKLRVAELRTVSVVGREGWPAGQLRACGLEPVILQARGSLNVRYLAGLVNLIRRCDARLVIAHLYGAAIYASLAGLLSRVPVISVLHGQSDVAAQERLGRLKRSVIARGSARIVFVSDALRTDLQRRLHLPSGKCLVIENGIDMTRYGTARAAGLRALLDLPPSAILVGAVGNLRSAKGYETLLQAAQIVCEGNPQVHFVIAGDTTGGLLPKLQQLQAALRITRQIHFLGLRSDVPSILADLDTFVLSSDTEGFSLALVEAMASGLPVVATRSGGPERIVASEQTGILVPPRDPQALAAALSRLLADAALRARLATAAKAAITHRFSDQRMLAEYSQLAANLLARAQGPKDAPRN